MGNFIIGLIIGSFGGMLITSILLVFTTMSKNSDTE